MCPDIGDSSWVRALFSEAGAGPAHPDVSGAFGWPEVFGDDLSFDADEDDTVKVPVGNDGSSGPPASLQPSLPTSRPTSLKLDEPDSWLHGMVFGEVVHQGYQLNHRQLSEASCLDDLPERWHST